MHADPCSESAVLLSRVMKDYSSELEKLRKTRLIIADDHTAYTHPINVQNSIPIPKPESPKKPSSSFPDRTSPINSLSSSQDKDNHHQVLRSESAPINSKSVVVSKSMCYILIG